MNTKTTCQYQDCFGHCPNAAEQNGWCFWHNPAIDKSTTDIKSKLEQYAQQGGFLRGLQLKHAKLSGIDLVHHQHKSGFDLRFCDFYRADISNAHLFNANLENASLMKANLENTNMNRANLKQCNLLGVKWSGCKIEAIDIGKWCHQHALAYQAYKQGKAESALDYYEQAEEIYRDLRKHAETEGIFSLAGILIQKELKMRRYQMPKYSRQRFFSKMVDIFCGYGEAPERIVGISLVLITICALLYSFTGLNYQDALHIISDDKTWFENLQVFSACLYYSVVTFTTLGYGDFTPVGFSRAIAAIEAFTGSFTIALFVVVFVKKMTR